MIILTTVVIESFIFTACYPCSKKVATQKWRHDTRANWIPIVYLIRLPTFLHVYFLLYCIVLYCTGASVAKWLEHLPFTSEAAGSSLSEYFLNTTRTQSSCEKSKGQRSAESRGFSPGTPVSSHRES